MTAASIWLTKLILAHLVTDFILQPKSWVEDRTRKHYASVKLYLHGIITALLAWALIGWQYWLVAVVILVTHTLIDGWKSYQKPTVVYFLADQFMHLIVIIACWYFTFKQWNDVLHGWQQINGSKITHTKFH